MYVLSCVLGQLWGAARLAKWHFFRSKLQWPSPSCSALCGEDRRACWCSSALHWCWTRERCSHIQVKATAFGPPLGVIKIEPYLALSIFLLLFIFIAVVAVIPQSYWLVEGWSDAHSNKACAETSAKQNKDECFALCSTPPIVLFGGC